MRPRIPQAIFSFLRKTHRCQKWSWLSVLGVGFCLLWAASATARVNTYNHRWVVVANPSAAGTPDLRPALPRLLEPLLKPHAQVVPYAAFAKAAKKAKLNPRHAMTSANIMAVASELKATHVVVLQAKKYSPVNKHKKAKTYAAMVSVFDIQHRKRLFSYDYKLNGKRLDHAVARAIAKDVIAHLDKKTDDETPEPVALVALPPPPVAAPAPSPLPTPTPSNQPLPPPQKTSAEPQPATESANESDSEETSKKSEEAPSEAPSEDSSETQPEASSEAPSEPPAPDRREQPGWRPWLRLELSEVAFFRMAKIQAGALDAPPAYDDVAGKLPPLFGRTQLQLEWYPLALGSDTAWYAGLGVEGQGSLGIVDTKNASVTYQGRVGGLGAGLIYRKTLVDTTPWLDIIGRLGYNYFDFPLQNVGFPGVGYRSPYVGFTLVRPFAVGVELLLSGAWLLRTIVTDKAATQLGVQRQVGQAYQATAGVRYLWHKFLTVGLLAFVDYSRVTFDGTTQLLNTNTGLQYSNVVLVDTQWGGLLTAGFLL